MNFGDIESSILKQLKDELEKYGILTYDGLPRKDYLRLLRYFTLNTLCKQHSGLPNSKNTIFYVQEDHTNPDILKFVKEIKKYFPFLLYITNDTYNLEESASNTEITLKLKEFRYSVDCSKLSFNNIKRFCKKHKLDNLVSGFKP